jgi:MoaA/NifB/PqqE/SkfB family radical SAM enzyme
MVAFQPLKTIYRGVKNMKKIYPKKSEWKSAIKNLKNLKKKYPENIRNSNLLIEHISFWPKYKNIKCWAGRAFCIIDVNGEVVPCDRIDYPTKNIPNCIDLGFKKAFENLPEARCSGCGFCGAMELNYVLQGKIEIFNTIKRVVD